MNYLQIAHKSLHGFDIASLSQAGRALLRHKQVTGKAAKFSKTERMELLELLHAQEQPWILNGVNFSRSQIADLLKQRDDGVQIEFETLGPYLGSYVAHGGAMTLQNLINEDLIGLHLAVVFRKIFPKARLVALCDEYNAGILGTTNEVGHFSAEQKKTFLSSLLELLKSQGALSGQAVLGKDFLLISESTKAMDAPQLVDILASQGYIERKGNEIFFVNDAAESPLHRRFHLRTKDGRWLCEALDAAAFLKPENLQITHIVVLPNYMKSQQDKLWEILRVLGIQPTRYHNIFYDPAASPKQIVHGVTNAFKLKTSH